MISLSPLILMVLAFVYWLIYGFVRSKVKEIQDYLVATIMIILFIFTPTLMEFVFQAMNCKDVINNGLRLQLDMHEVCFEGTHLIVFILLTIPSLILYVFVSPYLINRQLLNNKDLLNNIKRGEVTRYDESQLRILRIRLSFLLAGF